MDEDLIPTGKKLDVYDASLTHQRPGPDMSFNSARTIGPEEYDFCYAFQNDGGWHTAFLYERETGRLLGVLTPELGMQGMVDGMKSR